MRVNEVVWLSKNERSVLYAYSATGIGSSVLSTLTNAVILHGFDIQQILPVIRSESDDLQVSSVAKNDLMVIAIGLEFDELGTKLSLSEFVDTCELLLCADGESLRTDTVHRRQVDLFQIHDEVFRGGMFQRVAIERIKPFLVGGQASPVGSIADQQAVHALQSSVAQLGTLLDSSNGVPIKVFINVDEALQVRFSFGQLVTASCVGALRLRVEQEAGGAELQRVVLRLNRDLCALQDDGEPTRFGTCVRNCVLHSLFAADDVRRFFAESAVLDFPMLGLGAERRAGEPLTLLRYTAAAPAAALPFRLSLSLASALQSQPEEARDFLLTLTLETTLHAEALARNVRVCVPLAAAAPLRHLTASASAGTTIRTRDGVDQELRWIVGDVRGTSVYTNAMRLMFDSATRLRQRHLSPVRVDFDELTFADAALSDVRVEDVKLLDLTNSRIRNAHKFLKYSARADRSYLFCFV